MTYDRVTHLGRHLSLTQTMIRMLLDASPIDVEVGYRGRARNRIAMGVRLSAWMFGRKVKVTGVNRYRIS